LKTKLLRRDVHVVNFRRLDVNELTALAANDAIRCEMALSSITEFA